MLFGVRLYRKFGNGFLGLRSMGVSSLWSLSPRMRKFLCDRWIFLCGLKGLYRRTKDLRNVKVKCKERWILSQYSQRRDFTIEWHVFCLFVSCIPWGNARLTPGAYFHSLMTFSRTTRIIIKGSATYIWIYLTPNTFSISKQENAWNLFYFLYLFIRIIYIVLQIESPCCLKFSNAAIDVV